MRKVCFGDLFLYILNTLFVVGIILVISTSGQGVSRNCTGNCTTCRPENTSNCLTCKEGYCFWNSDKNDAFCHNTLGECKPCNDCGYNFFSGNITCSYNSTVGNLTAEACLSCPEQCVTCTENSTDASVCSCRNVNDNGTCRSNCTSLPFNQSGICQERCNDAWWHDDEMICHPCHQQCLNCSSFSNNSSQCVCKSVTGHDGICADSCENGYYNNYSICTQCDDNCRNCTSGSTNESDCHCKNVSHKNKCFKECPIGTFPEEQKHRGRDYSICQPCPTVCDTCRYNTTNSSAEGCVCGSAEQDGICVSKCTDGYEKRKERKAKKCVPVTATSGLELWQIIVIGASGLILLIIIVISIVCGVRKCRRNGGRNHPPPMAPGVRDLDPHSSPDDPRYVGREQEDIVYQNVSVKNTKLATEVIYKHDERNRYTKDPTQSFESHHNPPGAHSPAHQQTPPYPQPLPQVERDFQESFNRGLEPQSELYLPMDNLASNQPVYGNVSDQSNEYMRAENARQVAQYGDDGVPIYGNLVEEGQQDIYYNDTGGDRKQDSSPEYDDVPKEDGEHHQEVMRQSKLALGQDGGGEIYQNLEYSQGQEIRQTEPPQQSESLNAHLLEQQRSTPRHKRKTTGKPQVSKKPATPQHGRRKRSPPPQEMYEPLDPSSQNNNRDVYEASGQSNPAFQDDECCPPKREKTHGYVNTEHLSRIPGKNTKRQK